MAANPFNDIERKLDNLTSMVSELSRQLNLIKSQNVAKPLDIAAAAEFLGVTKSVIYQFTHKRTIPHFKRGRRIYFSKEDLTKWLQDNRKLTVEEIKAQA